MGPHDAASDPEGVARALIAENKYATIAASSPTGRPWACPVWFAARGLERIVWASKPDARHSLLIAENPRVSLVIFDSTKPPGEGSALYLDARAAVADDASFDECVDIYNAASSERGLTTWDAAMLRAPARHRLYRADVLEAFVIDDHDERVAVSPRMR